MHTTVLVTLFNDKRVLRTLESLGQQTRRLDRILVADGGSRDGTLEAVREFAAKHPDLPVDVRVYPGSVAETRNQALADMPAETGIVVFLDADQIAPDFWLEKLVAPIEAGSAEFTGGPTRPWAPPKNQVEHYINEFEAWFYPNVVAHDITALPMGNSAWRRDLFQKIGNFDQTLVWGGEDYDINLRAVQAGQRGRYVPDAWVYHDQSHLDTRRKVLRRKYRYAVGATVAYLKNGTLLRKVPGAAGTATKFRHRYEAMNLLVKPFALVRGLWAYYVQRR
ncbi:MAG TPA: glycosyltransferase [Candidatus Thermoplasmatota archaeon]|nr:glycosyltransferase [Candidatus Thermoplasmatota archaeon]